MEIPLHPSLSESVTVVLVGFGIVVFVLLVLMLITAALGRVLVRREPVRETAAGARSSAAGATAGADDGVPAEVVAVIAAAAAVALQGPQRIVSIRPVAPGSWSGEGRRSLFDSRRLRR